MSFLNRELGKDAVVSIADGWCIGDWYQLFAADLIMMFIVDAGVLVLCGTVLSSWCDEQRFTKFRYRKL